MAGAIEDRLRMKRPTTPPNTPARHAAATATAAVSAAALALLFAVGLTFSSVGSAQAAAVSVPLGSAGSYAVLAGSTVTNTGPSVITGNIGLSPGTAVTGFPPGIVNGTIHAADAVALQAKSDLKIGYNVAASEQPPHPVSGDLGGQTLTRGIYNSATSLGLTGALTLDGQGDPDSVWVFQAGSTLTTATASRVDLINGASACNVYWQIGSSATLGTASTFRGSILALHSITVTTGATIRGRVLARNGAVTLDTDTISTPNCAATPLPTTSAPTSGPTSGPHNGPTTGPAGPGAPTGGPSTGPPGQITQVPSGPPQTGDGGSVHRPHPILAITGALALLASMASFFLWRREDSTRV
jgi:hypothetical protein